MILNQRIVIEKFFLHEYLKNNFKFLNKKEIFFDSINAVKKSKKVNNFDKNYRKIDFILFL